MKITYVPVLLLCLLIGSCAPANYTPPESQGFLNGFGNGIALPFSLLARIFTDGSKIAIYASPNSGITYWLGFLLAISWHINALKPSGSLSFFNKLGFYFFLFGVGSIVLHLLGINIMGITLLYTVFAIQPLWAGWIIPVLSIIISIFIMGKRSQTTEST